jgi:hypothetical protein
MSELLDTFPMICVVGFIIFFVLSLGLVLLVGYLYTKDAEKNKIMDYQQAKQQMISALMKSAEEHHAGRLEQIEDGYEDLDIALPRNGGPEFDKLLNALYFWDCWIDARNHNWRQYDGVEADDWPRLAMLIVADLEADQEITNHLKKII